MTIRRNVRTLHDSRQVTEQRNEETLSNQAKVMEQLGCMQSQLDWLAFNIDLDTVDISGFFPIKDNDMVHRFLSDSKGNFNEKRKLFEFMLYTTVTNLKSMSQAFGESLLSLIHI